MKHKIVIKFTVEELNSIFKRLPEKFTYCKLSRLQVCSAITATLSKDLSVVMYLKPISNDSEVGYRDTRTDKIYANSNLNLAECRLKELALHEIAHRAGFVHHGKGWFARKMQNKLWYDTKNKLKSVPYTLGRIAREVCNANAKQD